MAGESVEELEAFVTVCRSRAHRIPTREGLDCAGPYDGRKSTFYASFATAFVLGSCGLPVTMHGSPSLPPKWGITMHDLLREAGIEADGLSQEKTLRAANQTGVLYVPTERWCPPLQALRPIRLELGMRTVLNTAEKLIDFAHSPYISFGVYHNTVFDRMTRLMIQLGFRGGLIVQGAEGSEDLFIDRPTRTYRVENGEFRLEVIDPEAIGIDTPVPDMDWTAAEQLRVSEAVLQGEAELGFINQVLLNAAVKLHLARRADSIEQGLYTCKAQLDSGAAWQSYEQWRGIISEERLDGAASEPKLQPQTHS